MRLKKAIHYAVTDSTFIQARQAWEDLEPDTCILISADEQTAGIGTRNRAWISPPQVNIYATYAYLTQTSNDKFLINISQIAAFSVVEVLQEYGLTPRFKWANDVLLAGKKICGILTKTEGKTIGNTSYRVIYIGIGLNVNMTAVDLPSDSVLAEQITSMKMFTGQDFAKDEVLAKLNRALLNNIQLLYLHGFSYFVAKIAAIFETFNGNPQWFDVKDEANDQHIVRGRIIGISEQGYLRLKVDAEVKDYFFGRLLKDHEIGAELPPSLEKPS